MGLAYINAQIHDFDGPLQFSPTKPEFHPTMSRALMIETTTNEAVVKVPSNQDTSVALELRTDKEMVSYARNYDSLW